MGKHNSEKDCWIIVHDLVLDCTKDFLDEHPGGPDVITSRQERIARQILRTSLTAIARANGPISLLLDTRKALMIPPRQKICRPTLTSNQRVALEAWVCYCLQSAWLLL